jgi:hypothetical protein
MQILQQIDNNITSLFSIYDLLTQGQIYTKQSTISDEEYLEEQLFVFMYIA